MPWPRWVSFTHRTPPVRKWPPWAAMWEKTPADRAASNTESPPTIFWAWRSFLPAVRLCASAEPLMIRRDTTFAVSWSEVRAPWVSLPRYRSTFCRCPKRLLPCWSYTMILPMRHGRYRISCPPALYRPPLK